jgi:hypothetical protein
MTTLHETCRKCLRGFVSTVLVALLLWSIFWWLGPIRPLVFLAADIKDCYRDAGITGDFSRLIVASCSPEAFHSYAKQQGMQDTFSVELPDGCPSWQVSNEEWWTPPGDLAGAYVEYNPKDGRRLLAYQQGILYYDILAW